MGISNSGKGCAVPGKPGIYTRLAFYYDWIQSITVDNKPTTTPPLPNSYQCDHLTTTCGCGYNNVELTPSRIVGGEEAKPYSWSMVVSIRSRSTNQHFCGGSILSASYILTAAHCVDDETADAISIVAGIHNRSDTVSTIRYVDVIYIHPNWSSSSLERRNDIALLHLSEPFDFSNNAFLQRTCVPDIQSPTNLVEYPVNRTRLAVIGWGLTRAGDSSSAPESLQQAEVFLMHHTDPVCSRALYDIEKQFCAALYQGGKGKHELIYSILSFMIYSLVNFRFLSRYVFDILSDPVFFKCFHLIRWFWWTHSTMVRWSMGTGKYLCRVIDGSHMSLKESERWAESNFSEACFSRNDRGAFCSGWHYKFWQRMWFARCARHLHTVSILSQVDDLSYQWCNSTAGRKQHVNYEPDNYR